MRLMNFGDRAITRAMRSRLVIFLTTAILASFLAVTPAFGQASFTGSYSQDFSSLPFSNPPPWVNNSTIPGLYALGSGISGSDGIRNGGVVVPTFVADNGSSNVGGIHSYGPTNSDERALGSIASGGAAAGDITFALVLQNTTSTTYRTTWVSFAGEQWRQGGNLTSQALIFDYAVLQTPPTTDELRADFTSTYLSPGGTYDFYAPIVGTIAAPVNGNLRVEDGGGRLHPMGGVLDIEWPPGAYLVLRWWDDNNLGVDHGLAIDDILVTASADTIAASAVDSAAGGAVVDGLLSPDEYGPGNSYTFNGAGGGFGGALGFGSIRLNSDADNLYVAFQPGATLNDYVIMYLDTRPGGFVDASMNDITDPGRNVVTNLGAAGDDSFPITPDFALVFHPSGCTLFELAAGSLTVLPITEWNCGSGANPWLREIAVPLTSIAADGGARTINFFAASCSDTLFNSNETIPPISSINAHTNPGQSGTVVYTLFDRFVTESPCSAPERPTEITASSASVCANDDGAITLNALGGSGSLLQWFAGACDTPSIGSGTTLVIDSPQATTTYFARWQTPGCGASDCASIQVTVISPPAVDAGSDASVCVGASVALAGSIAESPGCVWTGGAGAFGDPFSPVTTYTPGPEETGPIVLTLTALGQAPCAGVSDTVTITVNRPPIVDAGPDVTMCAGSSVALAGSGADAASFLWTGGTGEFADPTDPHTTYTLGADDTGPVILTLTASGLSGCTEAVDTVTVLVSPSPTVSAGSDVITCSGTPVALAGNGTGAGVLWSGGSGIFADPTNPVTTYTPGPGDVGFVTLTLSTMGNSPCVEVADTVDVLVAAPPAITYVDDNYTGIPVGTPVNFPHNGLPGPFVIGCNAFATIPAAQDAVTPSGTVHVAPGTYAQTTSITKSLTLQGAQAGVSGCDPVRAGAPESIISGPDGGFSINADTVVIDGFVIENATQGQAAGIAIAATASAYDIRNNIIRNNSVGIIAASRDDAPSLIHRNSFVANNAPNPDAGIAITANSPVRGLSVTSNCFAAHAVAALRIAGEPGTNANISINDNSLDAGNTVILGGVSGITITANRFTNPLGACVSILPGCADAEIRANTLTCDAAALTSGTALIDLHGVAGSSTVANNMITITGAPSQPYLHAINVGGPSSGLVGISYNAIDSRGISGAVESVGVRLHASLGDESAIAIEENSITGFVTGIHTEAARATIINNRGSISANTIGILVSGPVARVLIENNILTDNSVAAIRIQGGAIVDAGDCTGSNPTGIGTGSGPNGSSNGMNQLADYGFDDAAPWAIQNLNLATESRVTATANSFGPGEVTMAIYDASDDLLRSAVVVSESSGPTVTGNPSSTTICAGELAQFTATAWNAVAFQWRHDAVPLLGATHATLVIPAAGSEHAGQYDCVVTDACGLTVTTLPATLAVLPLPSPPDIAEVDRTDFCSDDPGGITLTAAGGSGATLEWSVGDCSASTIGTGPSLVIASPTVSTTYFARWRTVCGVSECATVTVNVLTPPVAPSSANVDRATICPTDAGQITLTAAGGSGNTLQWYANSCDSAPIGAGTSLALDSPNVTTTYYARWETPCGTSTCAQVTVSVIDSLPPVPDVPTLPPITGQCNAAVTTPPTATDDCMGIIVGTTSDPTSYATQGTFVITWTFNDGNGNITTQPQTVNVADTMPPTLVCQDAAVTLDATGNAVVTPSLLIASAADNCGVVNIVSIVPDTFTCANIGPNAVVVTIDDGHGNSSTCEATVTVMGGVSINTQPAPQVVCERQSVAFSVEIAGNGSETYQWRRNAEPILDATSSSITIPSAEPSHSGSYDVVITDACGSITSDAALLTVEHCPIIFVDRDATGASDGTSWTDAFTRVEDALAVAIDNDQIWVAEGAYFPDAGTSDRSRTFDLRSGVTLLGGFTGTELSPDERTAELHPTILSGDIGAPNSPIDNSFHVIDVSGVSDTCVIDGFIVEHGYANGSGPNTDKGAGSLCLKGNPTIVNCIFRLNSAARGGAVFAEDSLPVIIGCTFISNTATDGGGAIRAVSSAPYVINSRFLGNSTGTSGGGILNTGAGDARVIQCVFSGNAAASGAAIANMLGSFLSVSHCTIASNTASAFGGGVYSTQASSSVEITNSILFGNADSTGSGEQAQVRRVAGALSIDFCCIQGLTGSLGGSGNIAGDPRFTDPDGADGAIGTLDDDLRPGVFSPVIDAGSNPLAATDDLDLNDNTDTSEPIPVDIDGSLRFADDPGVADTGAGPAPVIDMGAYEFAGQSCPCDFNRSGLLNSQDFFDFLTGFFSASPAADYNRDTLVNSQDFFDFLVCFFAGCL